MRHFKEPPPPAQWVTYDEMVTREDLVEALKPLEGQWQIKIRVWEVLAASLVPGGKGRWKALPERVFYFTIHPPEGSLDPIATVPEHICKTVGEQVRKRFEQIEDRPA